MATQSDAAGEDDEAELYYVCEEGLNAVKARIMTLVYYLIE